jgi:hypothetical protein
MDTKSLVKALKLAVREVIKEELTEILKEGLQSTINEMQTKPNNIPRGPKINVPAVNKAKQPKFNENRWASILNQTEALQDKTMPIESYAEMMNESYDTLSFNSNDAMGFGVNRQNAKSSLTTPAVMEDPETGKVYNIAPEVQQVLTRDYSSLMKAINAKKGK